MPLTHSAAVQTRQTNMTRIAILLLLLPGNLFAEEVLSPEAFRTHTAGSTLYFAQNGVAFGVEQYLPDNRSIWQYADGTCTRGKWYAKDDLICFVYEDNPREQCWNFLKKGNSFAARALGREPESDLEFIGQNETPITCLAPEVGS